MINCNCGGTPKLEGGNGIGAYYYVCDPCDLQTAFFLRKDLAEQAWDILMKYEGESNESA